MASYLIYWQQFWAVEDENEDDFNDQWHTNQGSFYSNVRKGDYLWILVTNGPPNPTEWRLLQRIVVDRKRENPGAGRRYGFYGDKARSLKFDIRTQPDLTPTLHGLRFRSGKRIVASGRRIGNAIQTIRPLTLFDEQLLQHYSRRIERHSNDAGCELSNDTQSDDIYDETEFDLTNISGGFFGNPETNRKVERAAIHFVIQKYEEEGWLVRSVESDRCGYDLYCKKGNRVSLVEVKGVRGELPSFIITAAELKCSQVSADFVLCLVNSAMSKSPMLRRFTGKQLSKAISLMPLAFKATVH